MRYWFRSDLPDNSCFYREDSLEELEFFSPSRKRWVSSEYFSLRNLKEKGYVEVSVEEIIERAFLDDLEARSIFLASLI